MYRRVDFSIYFIYFEILNSDIKFRYYVSIFIKSLTVASKLRNDHGPEFENARFYFATLMPTTVAHVRERQRGFSSSRGDLQCKTILRRGGGGRKKVMSGYAKVRRSRRGNALFKGEERGKRLSASCEIPRYAPCDVSRESGKFPT